MSQHTFKLPDLGEGTVSAEIVAWLAQPGDVIKEDQPLVEMSTDKAVVEVPAPVSGRLVRQAGKPGDKIAVGAELAVFELGVTAVAATTAAATQTSTSAKTPAVAGPGASAPIAPAGGASATSPSGRIATSPATRRRASEAGIDLATVRGTGPQGRITPEDLDAHVAARASGRGIASTASTAPAPAQRVAAGAGGALASDTPVEIPVIGVRRVIAQRLSEAARSIPHFSYVEEVDISALQDLRGQLNRAAPDGTAALTPLPFVVLALVRALREWPQCNSHYDAQRERLLRYAAVHVGIATQTPDGLKVPVVRHAEALGLREMAHQIAQVSQAARNNTARREQLSGSTITVTSLGKLGGIASTPIVNMPEVAIIGLNRAVQRPMVIDGRVEVRWMMNLSSSFDHRFIDGADAAGLIGTIKGLLERPVTLFLG
jgi:2-oxoisovalerate dehydrogenase E2 component (dihydrolipoyl transacylase)